MLKDRHALNEQERMLLQGVANGLSYDEISQEMNYAVETLKGYMREILLKLNARNRTQAVAIAIREGIIE